MVLVLVLLASGRSAAAAPLEDPSCDPTDQANITGDLSDDGSEATFTVQNALPLCDPVTVGQAVYLKNADGLVFPQKLSDSATGTITTGSMKLSVTIPTNGVFPDCFWQADAFVGPVITDLDENNVYGPRLLDGLYGETETCAEVESESTTTSTTTTTTTTETTMPGDTTPPNTPEAEVLGAEVTRQEPLARTGPRFDVLPLIAAAGFLLIVGAVALTGGDHLRRR
jgi:hypothetical protein